MHTEANVILLQTPAKYYTVKICKTTPLFVHHHIKRTDSVSDLKC